MSLQGETSIILAVKKNDSYPTLNEMVNARVVLSWMERGFWHEAHTLAHQNRVIKPHPDARMTNFKMVGMVTEWIREETDASGSRGCIQATKNLMFSQGLCETTGQVHRVSWKLNEEKGRLDHFSPLHNTFVWVLVSCIIAGIKCLVGVEWHLSWVERLATFFYWYHYLRKLNMASVNTGKHIVRQICEFYEGGGD